MLLEGVGPAEKSLKIFKLEKLPKEAKNRYLWKR